MLALLAGCSTGLKANGPFGQSTSNVGSQCFPVRHNGVGTFGVLSFNNNGGRAQIDRVTLVGSHHLRIVAGWVVPITGHNLLGVLDGYPPGTLSPGIQWAQRQLANGAVIPHIPNKDTINLVLVLKPTGKQGAARSERIYYESGGTHYVLNLGVGIQVRNDQRGR